ncbi:MAG: hypothetical protein J0M04_20730 [Verrucomicrobia bacterium]|nr:hypothetical protein [Verrucomicrobiota bacterium]
MKRKRHPHSVGSGRAVAAAVAGICLIGSGVWWTLRGTAPTADSDPNPGPSRRQSAARGNDEGAGGASQAHRISFAEIVALCDSWEIPKLTREEIENHLNRSGRPTSGLLAASNLIEGPEYLLEAAKKSPSDPRVLLALLLYGGDESRLGALSAFRAAAPDNPLGDYFQALEDFRSGRTDEAFAAVAAATAKPGFESYALDTRGEMERMYRSAGYSPQAARVVAMFRDSQAGNLELAGLGDHLGVEIRRAAGRGDTARSLTLARQGLVLAERIRRTDTLLARAAASAHEMAVLAALPEASVIEPGGPTVGEMMSRCRSARAEIESLASMAGHLSEMAPHDAERYYDLAWQAGEFQAAQWLKAKLTVGE